MPVDVHEEQELRSESLTIVERSKAIKIVDQQTYDHACIVLTEQIIPFRKRLKDYFEGLRKPAYDAYQAVLNKFKDADSPAEQAEKIIKAEIRRFEQDQERLRQELQRKAQEEAENRAKLEQLEAAAMAEEFGASPEKVQQIAAQPVIAVAPPVERTFDRSRGVSTRENWKAEVKDMKALCKAIGAGKVPVNYVLPNESVLNARARADKTTLNIPGVVAYNDTVVSGRSR